MKLKCYKCGRVSKAKAKNFPVTVCGKVKGVEQTFGHVCKVCVKGRK